MYKCGIKRDLKRDIIDAEDTERVAGTARKTREEIARPAQHRYGLLSRFR